MTQQELAMALGAGSIELNALERYCEEQQAVLHRMEVQLKALELLLDLETGRNRALLAALAVRHTVAQEEQKP